GALCAAQNSSQRAVPERQREDRDPYPPTAHRTVGAVLGAGSVQGFAHCSVSSMTFVARRSGGTYRLRFPAIVAFAAANVDAGPDGWWRTVDNLSALHFSIRRLSLESGVIFGVRRLSLTRTKNRLKASTGAG